MSRHFHCELLLPGILLLMGCTSPAVSPTHLPDTSRNAESAWHERLLDKSVEANRQPTDSHSDLQNQFRLQAIESLILAGNSQTAKRHADAVAPDSLSPQQRNQLNLYYAQIDLSFGEAERALNRLDMIQLYQLNRSDLIKYHQSRAFGYSLTGKLIASATSRIALGPLLSPTQQQENNAAILETLSLIPLPELEQNLTQPSALLSGWIALARALKLKEHNRSLAESAMLDWQQTYPGHPAHYSGFLSDYLAKLNADFKQPGAIAVFLPESGPYARAGKAIREGILAAHYQDHSQARPSIRFYDSEISALPTLYHQAIAAGAEMIIGPLSKPDIQSLADGVDFDIPVLALNHVPEIVKPNLYQFGLSPIDDTEQITRRAWHDGHKNAAILIPDTPQGDRIGRYLKAFWERANGTVLEIQSYDPNQTDFSDMIKKMLKLNESERHSRQLAPAVKHASIGRTGIDVIFLNAHETSARSINPQLKFYHAGHIPVYATPHVYSGLPNLSLDFDLNNITFCDTPWLFDSAYRGELSLQALRETWRQFPASYLRLMAMGIDAYSLIAHLSNLDTHQYPGATGNLSLTDTNRIKRDLVCARFDQGQPNVLGFIDTNADDAQNIAVTPDEPSSEHEPRAGGLIAE